jgi:uncharacterized protein (DUF2237 family)
VEVLRFAARTNLAIIPKKPARNFCGSVSEKSDALGIVTPGRLVCCVARWQTSPERGVAVPNVLSRRFVQRVREQGK